MANVLVIAPDALVRFRSGRMLMHNTSNSLPAFETESPMLIGWLCQFNKPIDADLALAALQPSERGQVAQVIDYLRRGGVLVAPGTTQAKDAQALTGESKHSLRLLARSIYDASCDLNALGPQAESELQARTGIGIQNRLMSMLAAIDGLRNELRVSSHNQLLAQLQSLGVTPASRNLKLHIGCGPGHLRGWINIDVHPAPLALNVLRGLPFEAASADFVFVSHLLEHLFFPGDVKPFLQQVRRVLAPGGVVRIVVPDVEQCIAAYANNDRSFFGSRRETWSWWPENPTRLEDFLAYAGAGPEPAYLFESHKYGYDFETLSRVLTDAGFTSIVQSSYMQSAHKELQVDDVSSVAKAKYGDKYYSLFVEAKVP